MIGSENEFDSGIFTNSNQISDDFVNVFDANPKFRATPIAGLHSYTSI